VRLHLLDVHEEEHLVALLVDAEYDADEHLQHKLGVDPERDYVLPLVLQLLQQGVQELVHWHVIQAEDGRSLL